MSGKAIFKKGSKVMVLYQDINTGEPIYYAAEVGSSCSVHYFLELIAHSIPRPRPRPSLTSPPSFLLLKVKRSNKRPNAAGKKMHFYEVHFPGWGLKHDTWIEETSVTRFDKALHGEAFETGVGIPAADFQLAPRGIAPSSAATFGVPFASKAAGGKNKRKAIDIDQPKEVIPSLRLHVPAALKKIIIDDYNCVMQQGKILPLPTDSYKRPSVDKILSLFLGKIKSEQKKLKREGIDTDVSDNDSGSVDVLDSAEEMVQGLTTYFNAVLKQCLLYGPEVPLANSILTASESLPDNDDDNNGDDGSKKKKQKLAMPKKKECTPHPSAIYGGEHLVRLILKLPELVPTVGQMTNEGVIALESRLHDLMAYLVEEEDVFSDRSNGGGQGDGGVVAAAPERP